MKQFSLILIGMLIFSSLSSQKTLRRYKRLNKGEVNNELVSIAATSSKISNTTQTVSFKTVFDLQDRGQAALLKGKTSKESIELLNNKFLKSQAESKSQIDLTTWNIRIVFSISRDVVYSDKKTFSAYDRIENLNYSFQLDDSLKNLVQFKEWNKYSTEYGSIDIGTLEYNESFKADFGITGKIGASKSGKKTETADNEVYENTYLLGPEVSANIGTGFNNSRKENQIIKRKYIQLTGTFNDNSFSIHQQGTRETELAGNVSLDLRIKLPAYEIIISNFSNLYKKNNLANNDTVVNMSLNRYILPDVSILTAGVYGSLDIEYAVRHIKGNARTYVEFDDRIKYITGKNTHKETIIKKEDIIIPIYFISLKMEKANKSLTYKDGISNKVIHFTSYEKALSFKSWIIDYGLKNSNNKIKISNRDISFDGIDISKSMMSDYAKNIIICILK